MHLHDLVYKWSFATEKYGRDVETPAFKSTKKCGV